MTSCALLQSVCVTSHAAKGESVIAHPTDTSETASAWRRSNQDITAAIIGAKKLPTATPTRMP